MLADPFYTAPPAGTFEHPLSIPRRDGEAFSIFLSLETAMKPSIALDRNRHAMREITSRFRTANLRVFGSVLRGDDESDSDLDLLVDALPGATLFDLGGLQVELEELLGVTVDLSTAADLPAKFRDRILSEAEPV